MQLLYVLNRLQDLLGLPRTTGPKYPIDTDPLHSDAILVEDIWEATKIITLDQSRRGSAQISEVYHSVVQGQADYPLPADCCKLLDVEYVSPRNPRAQLDYIAYDQLVKYQDHSYQAVPSCYSLSESSSRKVLISATADSAGMVEYFTQGEAPLTTTVDGTQADVGDYIFNKTTKAEGEIRMLKSLYPILSIDSTSSTPNLSAVYIETPDHSASNATTVPMPSGNKIRITMKSGQDSVWGGDVSSKVGAGQIIYDQVRRSWLVIIDSSVSGNVVTLEHEGFVRGTPMSVEELITGVEDGGTQSTATDGLIQSQTNIRLGKADLLDLSTGNQLVSDASEGMTGGVDKLISGPTTTSSSAGLIYITDGSSNNQQTHIRTNINLTSPTNYIGTINSNNQVASTIGNDNGTYTGYLFILKDGNGSEYTGYLANEPDTVDWSLNSTADSFNLSYQLYQDVHLTTPVSNAISGIIAIDSYSIYRENFISGDSIQIEQRVPTLDSVTLFPIPNASDTQGTENLRFVYYAFPSKPKHVRSPVGLPESYSEALITKAFEIAKRRETGMVEPYNFSLHRSTSGRRHLPDTPVRDRPGRIVRPGLYTNVPIN